MMNTLAIAIGGLAAWTATIYLVVSKLTDFLSALPL